MATKSNSSISKAKSSISNAKPPQQIIYNLKHLKTKNQNKAIVALMSLMVILVFLVLVLPSIFARAEDTSQNIILGAISTISSTIERTITSVVHEIDPCVIM